MWYLHVAEIILEVIISMLSIEIIMSEFLDTDIRFIIHSDVSTMMLW